MALLRFWIFFFDFLMKTIIFLLFIAMIFITQEFFFFLFWRNLMWLKFFLELDTNLLTEEENWHILFLVLSNYITFYFRNCFDSQQRKLSGC